MKTKNKQKNIDKIPDGWEVKKLGKVFDITSSKRVFQSEWKSSGIPFYRARELVKLGVYGFVNNELFISQKMFDDYKIKYGSPQKNDLLVTGVGTIGITYLVNDFVDFYFKDGNVIWLKNKNLVSSKFVNYSFKTRPVRKQVIGGAAITTVATFTIDNAKNTKILFPPLPEQKRIVGVLGVWDEILEKLGRKIEVKKNIKKGLMQNLLMGEKRVGDFSEKWEEKKLGEICDFIVDNRGKTPPIIENGIPLVEVNAMGNKNINYNKINKFVSEEIFKSWFRKYLENGDILFSTVGRTAMTSLYSDSVKACIAQNIVGLRFSNQNDAFMYYLLSEDRNNFKFKRIEMVAVQPSVKVTQMIKLKFKIPSLEEQKAIAAILMAADEELAELLRKQKLYEEQKRFLLNNLISGDIRVPEGLSERP